jgi:hypothetical protein
MYNWTKKINSCVLAALRAITHNGIDPISHRTVQDIRLYLFTIPFKYQYQAYKAIRKINKLENSA